jgi:hypothetical protein
MGRDGGPFPPVAQMLAVLNKLALSLMDAHQVSRVARQIRRFASHPAVALPWIIDFEKSCDFKRANRQN